MYYRPSKEQDEKLTKMLESKPSLFRPRLLVRADVAKIVRDGLKKLIGKTNGQNNT
jgi:hypothetical protein